MGNHINTDMKTSRRTKLDLTTKYAGRARRTGKHEFEFVAELREQGYEVVSGPYGAGEGLLYLNAKEQMGTTEHRTAVDRLNRKYLMRLKTELKDL